MKFDDIFKWSLKIFLNKTPFIIAVEAGNKKLVQILLSNEKVDVNLFGI